MRVLIAPSLIACDIGHLAEEIWRVEAAGADILHVDVMDGHFVPNITFGPVVVKAMRRAAKLPLDVHLMLDEPERYAEAYREAGADYLTFHPEVVKDPGGFCRRIRAMGAKPGLAVRPQVAIETAFPYLDAVDMVMVMTVNPGFGGQKLLAECAPKIGALRRHAGAGLDIEVDGGVNRETIAAVAAQGANVIVAGSGVFGEPDIARAIADLRTETMNNLPHTR